MKKKLFSKLFAAMMAISLAFGTAACGNNSASGGDNKDNPPATEPSDAQKPDDNKEPENPETPAHYGETADFRYLVKNRQVTIIKWLNKNKGDAIIPETVEGYPVTAIAGSFIKCSGKKIEIPDSITYIDGTAFIDCEFEYNEKNNLRYWGNSQNPYLFLAGTVNRDITTAIVDENCKFIGVEAFRYCKKLTNVTIPDFVTSVGMYVFESCDSLKYNVKDNLKYLGNSNNPYLYLAATTSTEITSAKIDENCKLIGSRSFQNCSALTSLTIPNGVISIALAAFDNCGLQSISLPESVSDVVGISPNCTKLKNITVAKGNPKYHSAGNCIIETATNTLIAGCNGSIIPVDSNITSFGDWAFCGCDQLTSIIIPESVTTIGYYTFGGCSGLQGVYITNLEKWCNILFDQYSSNPLTYAHNLYLNNELITNLTIPDNVTSIGASAFYGCSGLTSITIPNSVTSIGNFAFGGCSGLTTITIPNSVTFIGDWAFANCSKLASVSIPDSITSIGNFAFGGCSKLAYNIKDNLKYLGNSENLYLYLDDTTSTSIAEKKIDENCKFIGTKAFSDCNSLTSVTIPDKVISIGIQAFYTCSKLTNIIIPNSVTSIGEAAFWGCGKLEKVYFTGSENQWTTINIDTNNESLTNTTRYYFSETQPTTSGNYWHYNANGEIEEW